MTIRLREKQLIERVWHLKLRANYFCGFPASQYCNGKERIMTAPGKHLYTLATYRAVTKDNSVKTSETSFSEGLDNSKLFVLNVVWFFYRTDDQTKVTMTTTYFYCLLPSIEMSRATQPPCMNQINKSDEFSSVRAYT